MTRDNIMAFRMLVNDFGKRERVEYLVSRILRLKRDVKLSTGEVVVIDGQEVGMIQTHLDPAYAAYEAVEICDALGNLNRLCLRLTGAVFFKRRFDYQAISKNVEDLIESEAFEMMSQFYETYLAL